MKSLWGYADPQDGDDWRFLTLVTKVIEAVSDDIRDLVVVRVDNWFGSTRKPPRAFAEQGAATPGSPLRGFFCA